VKIHLRTVPAIPPRGTRKRPEGAPEPAYRYDEAHGLHRRVRHGGYAVYLQAFADGEHGPYALVVSGLHPSTLYAGFVSARNAAGLQGSIDVCQRGDRIYLAQTADRERRTALRETVKATLRDFDASARPDALVPVPDGMTPDRLYQAMQYQRTRLGLGYVRVERHEDGVRLVNTMIEGGE
jgi:hypothetical protein